MCLAKDAYTGEAAVPAEALDMVKKAHKNGWNTFKAEGGRQALTQINQLYAEGLPLLRSQVTPERYAELEQEQVKYEKEHVAVLRALIKFHREREEIFTWAEAYGSQVPDKDARKWFNENWHSLNQRVMELQRVVREHEPIHIEKKYKDLTVLEQVQKSASMLAFYGDQASVRKEYHMEPPATDAEAKEWCYERHMAYNADKKMRALYEGEEKIAGVDQRYYKDEDAEEAAADSFRVSE